MSGVKQGAPLSVRRVLFLAHIWVGLAFCIPFALLGVTGSILVYEREINDFFNPAPPVTATGTIAAPQAILDAATKATPGMAAASLSMPQAAGDPAIVRLRAQERGAARGAAGPGRGVQTLVDPVTLQVLDNQGGGRLALMAWAHDYHGSLMIGGREGRSVIGWMGVGMLALGLSGIVLWWPRGDAGKWRRAVGVTKGARGWLFHRQLHGTAGIASWLLLIVLSFSGIAIAFPQTITDLVRGVLIEGPSTTVPVIGPGAPQVRVEPIEGQARIDADRAIAIALESAPNTHLTTLFLPAGREQPYRVFLLPDGAAQGSPPVNVFVDPYRAQTISVRDPWAGDLGDDVMTWQRPLHTGRGTNEVYKALIFIVGLIPVLFAITGVAMWCAKRRGRALIAASNDGIAQGVAAE
jgi:uncharacterized iron-regulated membrane protein